MAPTALQPYTSIKVSLLGESKITQDSTTLLDKAFFCHFRTKYFLFLPIYCLMKEGDLHMPEIKTTDATGVKAHAFNFVYSKYSDAYASIDTSNINNNNILRNIQYDHFHDHVKRIVLENKGAYVAKLRVHFWNSATQKWDYKTSKSFAVGKSNFWDGITELHLPNNSMMYPEVVVVWGKNKKCDGKMYYVRQDSTRVVTYRCKGTTLKPTISEV